MGIADFLFWFLFLALVVGVVLTIARGSINRDRGTGGAALTALHDLAPADKQRAIEIIVEKKGGKKWMEQESGRMKEPGAQGPPPSGSGPAGGPNPLTPPSRSG